jgi:hypothetical protein
MITEAILFLSDAALLLMTPFVLEKAYQMGAFDVIAPLYLLNLCLVNLIVFSAIEGKLR